MKYALISEEQIAQCVDAINKSVEMADGWTTVGQHNVLSFLKSLKPSEPVAWITPDGEGFRMRLEPPVDDVPLGWKALYTALDKEQA